MRQDTDRLARSRDAARVHYEQPHRSYHNWTHIEEMFAVADARGVALSTAQTMAILWHDAVYVPGLDKGMNEKASALLMRDQMFRDGWLDDEAGRQLVDAAAAIILDTVDHEPSSEAAMIVLDLDLYRLAVDDLSFDRYAEAIRAEYAPLLARSPDPDAAWRQGRAAVYVAFLARERIYHSVAFADLEEPARRNLERGLASLRG